MARKKKTSSQKAQRRDYPDEVKEEAIQMLSIVTQLHL